MVGAHPAPLSACILMAVSPCLGGVCVPVGEVSKSLHTSTAVEAISAPFCLPARFGYCGQGSGRTFWICSPMVHGGGLHRVKLALDLDRGC